MSINYDFIVSIFSLWYCEMLLYLLYLHFNILFTKKIRLNTYKKVKPYLKILF